MTQLTWRRIDTGTYVAVNTCWNISPAQGGGYQLKNLSAWVANGRTIRDLKQYASDIHTGVREYPHVEAGSRNPAPATRGGAVAPSPLDVAFALQARRLSARLDKMGVVTESRRKSAGKAGYSGPLTRREAAAGRS